MRCGASCSMVQHCASLLKSGDRTLAVDVHIVHFSQAKVKEYNPVSLLNTTPANHPKLGLRLHET